VYEISRLKRLLEKFKSASEPVWVYRNKRVGHNDLNTMIKPHDNPLPGIGRTDIDTILQLVSSILNVILKHYGQGELSFKPPPIRAQMTYCIC